MKVLLVEDNEMVREALEECIEMIGFDVVTASTYEQAVVAISDRPSVVISDIELGSIMDGIDLCMAIRRNHPEIPVMLMSGSDYRTLALAAGATDFLLKPLGLTELEAFLKNLKAA